MTTTSSRRRRAYDRANGIPYRINATQTRTHIERLTARGWTQQQIAAAALLNQATISIILSGQYEGVHRDTATAILNIRLDQPAPIPRGLTDATGTRRRVQALMVIGYPLADIARRARVDSSSLNQTVVDARWNRIRTGSAQRIAAVYRQLATSPPPADRLAEQARNEAMENGWHGPMAWECIDDPACEPEPTEPSAPGSVYPDDVRELAARGVDDAEIGRRLGVSPRTVARARLVHRIPSGVTV